MGHASTEMLFKVFACFVPNLTRQDGSAFERLLVQSGTVRASIVAAATESSSAANLIESAKEPSHD
jgi:integrase